MALVPRAPGFPRTTRGFDVTRGAWYEAVRIIGLPVVMEGIKNWHGYPVLKNIGVNPPGRGEWPMPFCIDGWRSRWLRRRSTPRRRPEKSGGLLRFPLGIGCKSFTLHVKK
jgi:hypothetical protein